MNRGFTVVEVLVTLVVISILLGLGTVGLRATLANGRDAERKADIETIAKGLETRYDKGSSFDWKEDTNGDGTPDTNRTTTYSAGSYPGSNELWETRFWYGRASISDILPGVSEAAWRSPSNQDVGAVCLLFGFDMPRCDAAEKQANIQGLFSDGSGGWKDIYVYEFIGSNNAPCDSNNCVRYNLYWISETDKSTSLMGIPGLKVWKSKHT